MTTPVSLIGRKAQLAGLRDVLIAARYYSGLPPDTPDEAPNGTLLGEVVFPTPCGVVGQSGLLGTLTFTCPQITNASGTGLIGYVRLIAASDDGLLDLRAGLAADNYPVVLNELQVYAGGEIQLLSCVLTQ